MNRSQYNECVNRYADGIFRFVLSNLRDRERASDVVQETFAKVWERRDDVSWEKCKAYLFQTAYHTLIDDIRKQSKVNRIEDTDRMESHSVYTPYPDVQEVLHKALAKLPEIQRSVVLLRDYEGYSYQEIAEIAGLSESQVKVYIFRARTALKKELKSIDNLIDVGL
ncbi:MAG: RNA polymerase sigma factor [Candidatus Limimorpha sp.]|mgnify:FL=1